MSSARLCKAAPTQAPKRSLPSITAEASEGPESCSPPSVPPTCVPPHLQVPRPLSSWYPSPSLSTFSAASTQQPSLPSLPRSTPTTEAGPGRKENPSLTLTWGRARGPPADSSPGGRGSAPPRRLAQQLLQPQPVLLDTLCTPVTRPPSPTLGRDLGLWEKRKSPGEKNTAERWGEESGSRAGPPLIPA